MCGTRRGFAPAPRCRNSRRRRRDESHDNIPEIAEQGGTRFPARGDRANFNIVFTRRKARVTTLGMSFKVTWLPLSRRPIAGLLAMASLWPCGVAAAETARAATFSFR